MKQYVAVGLTVLVGAALIETALIPGILIGGAAVLAPRLTRLVRLPGTKSTRRRYATGPRQAGHQLVKTPSTLLPRFAFGQAVAKTVTYRIIVTPLDFSTNYIVIGELATAAGLSTFNLVAGPLFYLGHEAVWNYIEPREEVDLAALTSRDASDARRGSLTISRALAKTVTFRTIATVVDFTTNYVVVGDAAAAVLLSATGFVLGPFVYYGHEKGRGSILVHLQSDSRPLQCEGRLTSAASKLKRSRKFLRCSRMSFRNARSASFAIMGAIRSSWFIATSCKISVRGLPLASRGRAWTT